MVRAVDALLPLGWVLGVVGWPVLALFSCLGWCVVRVSALDWKEAREVVEDEELDEAPLINITVRHRGQES